MAKYLRYKGSFRSVAGVLWEVRIMQEADKAFSNVGELVFPAERPLLIEWPETGKLDPVAASNATLTIESPGDRTFADLYTIKPDSVRLDVYREGKLYWRGLLDPEQYEEPYERAANYDVSLTFSDFGILDRLKYRWEGMQSIEMILRRCASGADIGNSIGYYTSLTFDGKTSFAELQVDSDNFYDEDGEPMSLREVLEGVLQPLALRVVQTNGQLVVYDLHGLHGKAQSDLVEWWGDKSTMSADVVYNDVVVTWSPYSRTGNLAPEECWTGRTEFVDLDNIDGLLPSIPNENGTNFTNSPDETLFTVMHDIVPQHHNDPGNIGFEMVVSDNGKNATLGDGAKFFRILPGADGSDDEGVAVFFQTVGAIEMALGEKEVGAILKVGVKNNGIKPSVLYNARASVATGMLMRSTGIRLPAIGEDSSSYWINVKLPLLLDTRWNPFTEAEDHGGWLNQKTNAEDWAKGGNYFFVPVKVLFTTDDGKVYQWVNRDAMSDKSPSKSPSKMIGAWEQGNSTGQAFSALCYYEPDNVNEGTKANKGWCVNSPAIFPGRDNEPTRIPGWVRQLEGQPIPYPNVGKPGTLTVEVQSRGWRPYRAGEVTKPFSGGDATNLRWAPECYGLMTPASEGGGGGLVINADWGRTNWILLKLPEISIMRAGIFSTDTDRYDEDVVYTATINPDAKETLSIDTICGSADTPAGFNPLARGAYYVNGSIVGKFGRAGRTSQAEDLLIGTAYSQYAERHVKLSGIIKLDGSALRTYTEANQPGKLFIKLGSSQDVRTDEDDAILVELSPDHYTPKN